MYVYSLSAKIILLDIIIFVKLFLQHNSYPLFCHQRLLHTVLQKLTSHLSHTFYFYDNNPILKICYVPRPCHFALKYNPNITVHLFGCELQKCCFWKKIFFGIGSFQKTSVPPAWIKFKRSTLLTSYRYFPPPKGHSVLNLLGLQTFFINLSVHPTIAFYKVYTLPQTYIYRPPLPSEVEI